MTDLLLVLGLVVCELVSRPYVERELPPEFAAVASPVPELISAGLALLLFARHRFPLLTFLGLALAGVLTEQAGAYTWPVAGMGMVVASYSIGRYQPLARALLSLAVAFVANILTDVVTLAQTTPLEQLLGSVVVVTAWWLGRLVRMRSFHLAELRARAERLERARDAHTRAVLAEERSRIARELHDVVAHHVSVMTVQATAGRRIIERDIERARQALVEIEDTGRQAMAEMRRLVGLLRAAEPERGRTDWAPQPGLDGLEDLVRQVRETGLDVSLTVEGEWRALPPGLDLTLYRVAQESLTNVLKHAGAGARASVLTRYDGREVWLEVRDDGAGGAGVAVSGLGARPRAEPGDSHTGGDVEDEPGHGLLGMAERVGLFGGELTAEPQAGGGFVVLVRIPLSERPRCGEE